MKPRKTSALKKTLTKKGFVQLPEVHHHPTFVLHVDGKITTVRTHFSHGVKEYGSSLMQQVKRQLGFTETPKAELFFDCPMDHHSYVAMLIENGVLPSPPPVQAGK